MEPGGGGLSVVLVWCHIIIFSFSKRLHVHVLENKSLVLGLASQLK